MENDNLEEPVVAYEQLDPSGLYTYWDYLKWQFSERVELIKGRIFKMSPAPVRRHQKIVSNLSGYFFNTFHPGPCEFYLAPFDVRLPVPNAGKDSTVVQPDICVVCDQAKLDERGCNSAPELVVEILSKGSEHHDMVTKFELYELSGVREYWIVQPESKSILIFSLIDGKFIGLPPLVEGQTIRSPLFPQFDFEVGKVFE